MERPDDRGNGRGGWVRIREGIRRGSAGSGRLRSERVIVDGGGDTWRNGFAKGQPFQEDYACPVGLLELYRADFDVRWIRYAEGLAEEMISDYWDAGSGGFYFSQVSHQTPIIRSKNPTDGVTQAGNSAAAHALTRLGRLWAG